MHVRLVVDELRKSVPRKKTCRCRNFIEREPSLALFYAKVSSISNIYSSRFSFTFFFSLRLAFYILFYLDFCFFNLRQRAIRVFNSAPIVIRYDPFTLETADGICVVLESLINKSRTSENGFSSEAMDY